MSSPTPTRSDAPAPPGGVLAAVRHARHLSLAAVADATDTIAHQRGQTHGVSPGYLSKLERGVHTASPQKLGLLAAVYQVDTAVLTRQVPAIATLRTIQRLSPTELADAVGVTDARLAQFERGTERPSQHELDLLAVRLGVSPSVLLAAEPSVVAS